MNTPHFLMECEQRLRLQFHSEFVTVFPLFSILDLMICMTVGSKKKLKIEKIKVHYIFY